MLLVAPAFLLALLPDLHPQVSAEKVFEFTGHEGAINRVAFSPDSKLLASTSWDKTARVWDLQTGKELLVLNHATDLTEIVASVHFSADGTRLVTGTARGTVSAWDVKSGKLIRSVRPESPKKPGEPGARIVTRPVALSPDGKWAVAGDALLNAETLDVVGWLGEVFRSSHNQEFLPDGKGIVLGTSEGIVLIRDFPSGRVRKVFKKHDHEVCWVSVSDDGKRIASGGFDYSPPVSKKVGDRTDPLVKIWDIRSGKELKSINAWVFTNSFDLAPRSPFMAFVGGSMGVVRLLDTGTGESLWAMQGTVGTANPAHVTFNKDGTLLAAGGGDKNVYVWKVTLGTGTPTEKK